MAMELFQPTSIRTITANSGSTGVTGGFKFSLSGESTSNANSVDVAEAAFGSAVSGAINCTFRLLGVMVANSASRNTGISVNWIVGRGPNYSGVSLAFKPAGTSILNWAYFPDETIIVPATDTIQIHVRSLPSGTAPTHYISAVVQF